MNPQPPLPFKQLEIQARHIRWLQTANAGDYSEKKSVFYPFKSRFCRAHGITDGQDLQTITLKCWCGDGVFRGVDDHLPKDLWQACHKCGGTGIYLKKNILLIRWLVGGVLFHEPSTFAYHSDCPVKERFEGLIKHAPVDSKAACRAMERLLLRYEPETLKRLYLGRAQSWAYWKKTKIRFAFNRLNQRLRAMFGAPMDDVPF